MHDNIICINNISNVYKNIKALDNVSFKLARVECILLIGLNGACKSTLLSVISSLLFLTNGEVLYKDQPIEDNCLLR